MLLLWESFVKGFPVFNIYESNHVFQLRCAKNDQMEDVLIWLFPFLNEVGFELFDIVVNVASR